MERVPVPVRSRFSTPFFSANSIKSKYCCINVRDSGKFGKLSPDAYIGKAGQPAMAINDCVISGPDPGAVPGASTTSPFRRVGFCGGETGSTDVERLLFCPVCFRRYRTIV